MASNPPPLVFSPVVAFFSCDKNWPEPQPRPESNSKRLKTFHGPPFTPRSRGGYAPTSTLSGGGGGLSFGGGGGLSFGGGGGLSSGGGGGSSSSGRDGVSVGGGIPAWLEDAWSKAIARALAESGKHT